MDLNYKISFNILSYYLILIVLLSYLLEGISIAIMHNYGIFLDSSPFTIFRYIFLFPLSIMVLYSSKKRVFNSFEKKIIIFFCFCIIVKFIIQLNNPILELSTLLNYVSPIFMATLILFLDNTQIENIFKVIFYFALFFSIISILQAFAPELLSDSFKEAPQLDKSKLKSVDLVYDFVKITRPNGLMGNAIEFGFFLNSAIFIAMITKNISKKFLVIILSFGLFSILLTLSRAAIAQVLILLIFYFLFKLRLKNKFKSLLFVSFILFAMISYFDSYSELFMNYLEFSFDRIFDPERSVKTSNLEHQKDYINSLEAIKNNFILGVPFGTNKGATTVITDGSWFHFVLEFGIFIFIIFLVMVNQFCKFFFKSSEDKKLSIIYLFLLIVLGFLNSAILSKINYFIFFLLIFSFRKSLNNVRVS